MAKKKRKKADKKKAKKNTTRKKNVARKKTARKKTAKKKAARIKKTAKKKTSSKKKKAKRKKAATKKKKTKKKTYHRKKKQTKKKAAGRSSKPASSASGIRITEVAPPPVPLVHTEAHTESMFDAAIAHSGGTVDASTARETIETRIMAAAGDTAEYSPAMYAANAGGFGNVLGFGVGDKISDGRYTGQTSIKVYVREKLPERAIASEFLVPKTEGRFVTDVEECCDMVALQGYRERYVRPVPSGSSIGPPTDGILFDAGTLGCIVRAKGKLCILSNNHVLARVDQVGVGTSILQPGTLDYPSAHPQDYIGQLLDAEPIRFGLTNPNLMDAALAWTRWELSTGFHHCFSIPTETKTPFPPEEKQAVVKCGRSTGYTEGRIIAVNVSRKVDYPGFPTAYFRDQVLVEGVGPSSTATNFVKHGDSGSLIVTYGTHLPVALLFAGRGNRALASPMGPIITRFGITEFNPIPP